MATDLTLPAEPASAQLKPLAPTAEATGSAERAALADIYRWLMAGFAQGVCARFDAHVVASVLSLAIGEAYAGRALVQSLGLSASELVELVSELFPHARPLFAGLDPAVVPERSEEEQQLRDLLTRGTTSYDRFERRLASVVARRAQQPNHLWQDLGLRTRSELGWLMERHFEPLALRNARGMRWKKFLYRMICRDVGYSICSSPICSECSDFDGCFGDERGDSLLLAEHRK